MGMLRRIAIAGTGAALAWAVTEQLARQKTVRVSALLAIAAGMGAMATSSVKSQTTETRVNNLVNAVAALQAGKFSSINGGYSVTITAEQDATMYAGVLSYFTQDTNAQFLSGLSSLPSQSDSNSTLSGVCAWANNKEDNMRAHGFGG